MAIQRDNQQQPQQQQSYGNQTNGRQKKEFMGYLNLKVKTASGEFISVPCFIGLEQDNVIHQGMMKKFESEPNFVFEIQGSIGVKQTQVPEF